MTAKLDSLRARAKNSTREQMLRSAEICFAQKGYQSTNLDDVAAMTRVSRAAVYFHFRGKQEIVQELVNQAIVDTRVLYETLPSPQEHAADPASLDRWVQAQLNLYHKTRDRRIVLRQAQAADAGSRRTIAEGAKELIEVVARRIGLPPDLGEPAERLRTRIRLAIITTDAVCYVWAIDRTLSKAEAADELKRIWSRVVDWAND